MCYITPCLHQVVYKEKDSDSAVYFWTVEGNTTLSVQLTGLGKYVLYEIQVLAFTRVGDGRPSSPPILQRTLDDGRAQTVSNITSLYCKQVHKNIVFLFSWLAHLYHNLISSGDR